MGAKNLIRGMLNTNPDQRLTIDEVIENKWISQYIKVPKTPLLTLEVLKSETDEQWEEMQGEPSKTLKIKNPQNSNSALAKRRRNKAGNSLSPIHRLAKNVAKLGAAPLIYINSLKT